MCIKRKENKGLTMIIECVCEDCGINVPFELQYGVRLENGDYKIVCENCINKYHKVESTDNIDTDKKI